MGACAREFKSGDAAWKCEDCKKDPFTLICTACYEKGDHKGHRVWLMPGVYGSCDCGDADLLEEAGFCSDHKGFAASSHTLMASLPAHLKESAPRVYSAFMSVLKTLLL
jgi:hypothetical protein